MQARDWQAGEQLCQMELRPWHSADWAWASGWPWEYNRPVASWAVLGGAQPGDGGKWSLPCVQHVLECTWNTPDSCGPPGSEWAGAHPLWGEAEGYRLGIGTALGHTTSACSHLWGLMKRQGQAVHSGAWQKEDGGGQRLEQQRFRVVTRKSFFNIGTSKFCNMVPREAENPGRFFKTWLLKALASLIWPHNWLTPAQEVELGSSWGPFSWSCGYKAHSFTKNQQSV